jgi:iron-sulfur cluster repair protein YtfE (RIC family)
MEAMQAMRQDHAILRRKIALLESAMQAAPEARFVLREMCFSLQRLLQDHLSREERVLQVYASSGDQPAVPDHAAAADHFRGVLDLLFAGMRASMPAVIARLSRAVELLEAQMAEQERLAFPVLDHAIGLEGLGAEAAISGTMSVNEILLRYPQTERLFEQLHVNRVQEGYKSVDELAWCHGMDVSQFLEQLRQAAASFTPDDASAR